jgi:hypothetical protein
MLRWKIDAVFVDDGMAQIIAALCMMVEMKMKKRQVHEDEAIQLPLS